MNPERFDRLETKIDALHDSVADLKAILAAQIARQEYMDKKLQEIEPLKEDVAKARGAASLSAMVAVLITALGSILVLFKK